MRRSPTVVLRSTRGADSPNAPGPPLRVRPSKRGDSTTAARVLGAAMGAVVWSAQQATTRVAARHVPSANDFLSMMGTLPGGGWRGGGRANVRPRAGQMFT